MRTEVCLLWLFCLSLRSAVPVDARRISKCCPVGQSLFMDDPVAACDTSHFNFQPIYHTKEGPKLFAKEEMIFGLPCPHEGESYILEPQDFTLLDTGFLDILDQEIVSSDKYCLEVFESGNGTLIRAIVCSQTRKEAVYYIIQTAGSFISGLFLLFTCLVYLQLLEDLQGKLIFFFSSCLATAYLSIAVVLLLREEQPVGNVTCKIFASLIQLFYLGIFSWLNVIGLHSWREVRLQEETSHSSQLLTFCYCMYGYGLPLAVFICTVYLGLDPLLPPTYLKPHFGYHISIMIDEEKVLFFCGLIYFLLIVDLVLCILSIAYLVRNESCNSNQRICKKPACLRHAVLLAILMLSWTLEMVAWRWGDQSWGWLVPATLGTLQGVAVYVIYVHFEERARLVSTRWWFKPMRINHKASQNRDHVVQFLPVPQGPSIG